MAAATLEIGSIFGTVAIINYDDITLVVSSVTFDTSQGTRQVSLDITVGAQHQSVTASPGINATMLFSPPITLVRATFKGKSVVEIQGATTTMQGIAS